MDRIDNLAPEVLGDPARDLYLMRRVAITMFTVGTLSTLSGLVDTHLSGGARTGQAACAVTFFLCGVAVLLIPPRRWLIEAFVFVSLAILGTLVAIDNPLGVTPYFYLWPVVFTAYFCPRRILYVSLLLMMVTLAVGLSLNLHAPAKVDLFVSSLLSVGLMAALVKTMVRREVRLRDELESLAETDPLTGLFNRRAFNRRLTALIGSPAGGRPLVVVLFDLDHLKRFNDQHGHAAGDDALRRTAEVMRRQSRNQDIVSRFGGEEFAVALPDAGLAGGRAYTDRVARAFLDDQSDPSLRLSTSAGIAILSADGDFDDLLSAADQALYAAKQAGRARAAWWDGEIQVGESLADPSLERQLQLA
jgi:diguanylate cyclase (GGDEF)-like protein